MGEHVNLIYGGNVAVPALIAYGEFAISPSVAYYKHRKIGVPSLPTPKPYQKLIGDAFRPCFIGQPSLKPTFQ